MDIKKYELMLIFSGEMPEGDFEKQLEELRKFLKENTQKVFHEEVWGRRNLAYRVKRQSRGYYAIFDFEAVPSAIAEIRTNVKFIPSVLRHIIVELPPRYEPGKYHDLRATEKKDARRPAFAKAAASKQVQPAQTFLQPELKPTIAGKKEEQELETVEKKLEKILENPDIDIR